VVANVPAELVDQKVLVPQVPVGVTPAPAVAPLLSQYRIAALADGLGATDDSTVAQTSQKGVAHLRRRESGDGFILN
jgi:hypothetical protein